MLKKVGNLLLSADDILDNDISAESEEIELEMLNLPRPQMVANGRHIFYLQVFKRVTAESFS